MTPLLGFLVGAAICALGVFYGACLFGKLCEDLPGPARWGLCGALGFGAMGLLLFLVGLVSTAPAALIFAVLVVGFILLFMRRSNLRLLKVQNVDMDLTCLLLAAFIAVLFLFRLPSALSPSDAADWDSISHQLAMSKLWLAHGKVDYIPFMHQSNIPATVNMLYMLALSIEGQFAAKTVAFGFSIFAVLMIGGLAAYRYGRPAGYWSAFAFAVVPVVLWETGTAYVDVAHGVFAGGAILFAAMMLDSDAEQKRRWFTLCGISLGFALATKYTGFQIGFGIGAVVLVCALLRRSFLKGAQSVLAIVGIALAISAPWYVRNIVNTGNPVYPFFYSVFRGSNWSEENAAAYAEEQRSFGIGQKYEMGEYAGKDPLAFPAAVSALAVQPDKQINQGAVWGAIGPLFILALLWWPASGRTKTAERAAIFAILIVLLTWFFLTQQSRYIISLMVPCAFLLGGAVAKLRLGSLLAAIISAQGIYTLYLFGPSLTPLGEQMEFIANPDASKYLDNRLPFYKMSQFLNELGKERRVKVALYDEPRGFYLDVDYWWANPGHSRIMHYENLQTGEDLVRELIRTGSTHVYLNLEFVPRDKREAVLAGAVADDVGYRKLVVDAAQKGLLAPVEAIGSGILYEIR